MLLVYGCWFLGSVLELATTNKTSIYCGWVVGNFVFNGGYAYVFYFTLRRDTVFLSFLEDAAPVDRDEEEQRLLVEPTRLHDYVAQALRIQGLLDPRLLFTDSQPIGQGGSAAVFTGTYKGQRVAVKRFYCEYLSRQDVHKYCQEAHLMMRLKHRNIVEYIGVCVDPPYVCILMKYYANGSLRQVLDKQHEQLHYEEVLRICLDAARGLEFLHGQSPPIVWRDGKSLNYLVDEHGVS